MKTFLIIALPFTIFFLVAAVVGLWRLIVNREDMLWLGTAKMVVAQDMAKDGLYIKRERGMLRLDRGLKRR